MTDFPMYPQDDGMSSGFVGTVFCWVVGIAICICAVAFSLSGGLLPKAFGMLILLFGAIVCGWARTAAARWKLRFAAVFISSCFILLVTEGATRLMTKYPVSLHSSMVAHKELGYVLDPNLPEVDANGFLNASVLESADIVTIGDSHTQGINVTPEENWPNHLAAQLGQTVYNMSVGGYGPLQYDKLVTQALLLRPKQVVVGLYLGNDLSDAIRGIQERQSEGTVANSLRHTLEFHTALGSITSRLIRRFALGRPAGFGIPHPANPTYVATARIESLSRSLDATNPKIVTAMNSTVAMLAQAHQRCLQHGARLTVLIIPTRESVYFTNQQNRDSELPGTLAQIAESERGLREHLMRSLATQQVGYVDILPSMAAALDAKTEVYANHDDGQPLSGGYATYAAAVSQHLSGTSATTN